MLHLDPRQLVPDDENVRQDSGDLEGLASSLRLFGVLQPLGVAPLAEPVPGGGTGGHRYRVVYGSRRRAAAIMAGLPTVPCVPVSFPDSQGQLVAQLLENMQRRDLNDMEKADGLARLRRHVAAGLGSGAHTESVDSRVAELVGLSPRTVRRYLALRELAPAVRDLLAEARLTVTQAQHLTQLEDPRRQEAVAERAAAGDWTAAQVSRVCAALARSSGMSLDDAVAAASDGWQAVERLGPAREPVGAATVDSPARVPRSTRAAAATADAGDADLWQEDATGAPTPEALGEPDHFAAAGTAPGGSRLQPETADGHRVFRIRTLSAFCDEVDRLARCIQEGDLRRAIRGDQTAATRLSLAAKQLAFTLQSVEGLVHSS